MTILDKIIEQKRIELSLAKKNIPIEMLKDTFFFQREGLSLKTTVKERSGIIAEFKRQSPSKGIINAKAQPLEVATAYQTFGASGISVLTDFHFFGGNIQDILSIREHIHTPILRKDFMIEAYQFYEAKAIGADVVLLIAACLSPLQVSEFTDLAHQLGLEVLLELHTEEELNHFNSEVDLVGINNRNLKDFKVDLEHSVRLKNALPSETLSVAESGIYALEDFKYLKKQGFDAFLMGEFFMKNENPAKKFEQFANEISNL